MKLTTGYKKPIASSGTDALELSSNNSYLLLAGGGHKALSDFATAGHTHNNYLERLQWWNEADSHNVDNLTTGTTFAYQTHNAPTNGTIVAFSNTSGTYQLQLQGQYIGENLWFRNKNGDNYTWNAWRYVIHDGNISSQSVNYATSAGNAATATNADTIDGEHADSFLKRLRRNNLNISSSYSGMVPPDILSFKNGYPVYTDPEFATDYNSISVYNYGGSGVTITRESSTTSGNSSGYCLHIKSSTSGYPNGGGWCFATNGTQARVSVCIFRANIPEGYNVKFYSNSTGDGSNVGWLTSTEGTGKYEWYAYMVEWGSSPSDSFYFTLDKAADVDWYLSYANVIDISRASYDGLRTRYSDYATSAGDASSAAKLTTSAGSAALPIYFSDGVPVDCTAESVFSNLSNIGNDLSVTVAGKNRTITVAYAESAGNAGTLGGYHESTFSKNGHTHTTSEITNFPTIGNGALHIKVNGTELTPEGGIFTANKSGDSTIDLKESLATRPELNTLGSKVDKIDTSITKLNTAIQVENPFNDPEDDDEETIETNNEPFTEKIGNIKLKFWNITTTYTDLPVYNVWVNHVADIIEPFGSVSYCYDIFLVTGITNLDVSSVGITSDSYKPFFIRGANINNKVCDKFDVRGNGNINTARATIIGEYMHLQCRLKLQGGDSGTGKYIMEEAKNKTFNALLCLRQTP